MPSTGRSRASRRTRRSRSGPGGSSRSARASRPHEGAIVGTSGLFTLRLAVPGAVVPMAGVTAVGVDPSHRRRGLLDGMMHGLLEEVRERGDEAISALWASEAGIYGRWGFGSATRWAEVTVRSREAQLRRPPGDRPRGGDPKALLPELRAVYDALPRRPGMLERDDHAWGEVLMDVEAHREGAGRLRAPGVRRRLRDLRRAQARHRRARRRHRRAARAARRGAGGRGGAVGPPAQALAHPQRALVGRRRGPRAAAHAVRRARRDHAARRRPLRAARRPPAGARAADLPRAGRRRARGRRRRLPVERGPLAARGGRDGRDLRAHDRARRPRARRAGARRRATSAGRRWRRSAPPAASRRRRPARSPRRAMRSSASARRGRSRSSSPASTIASMVSAPCARATETR